MARQLTHYSDHSRNMLTAIKERTSVTADSFHAHLESRGVDVGLATVKAWWKGANHLPADVLGMLAAHSGHPKIVFSAYLRAADCTLVPGTVDGDEADLYRAIAGLGDFIASVSRAQSEGSEAGASISPAEATMLLNVLDRAEAELAKVRAMLEAVGQLKVAK